MRLHHPPCFKGSQAIVGALEGPAPTQYFNQLSLVDSSRHSNRLGARIFSMGPVWRRTEHRRSATSSPHIFLFRDTPLYQPEHTLFHEAALTGRTQKEDAPRLARHHDFNAGSPLRTLLCCIQGPVLHRAGPIDQHRPPDTGRTSRRNLTHATKRCGRTEEIAA